MDMTWFLPWFGLMFPLAFSAGPNNLMCASCGAAYGFRKTLPLILGINTIIALYSIMAGTGIGELFIHNPWLMKYFRIAGCIYILWLAYGFFRAGMKKDNTVTVQSPGYFTGIVISALNPKLIFALILMYSQFFNPSGKLAHQVVVLTIAVVLLSASAHVVWTMAGNFLSLLLRTDRMQKVQYFFYGSMLVLVAFWLIL